MIVLNHINMESCCDNTYQPGNKPELLHMYRSVKKSINARNYDEKSLLKRRICRKVKERHFQYVN